MGAHKLDVNFINTFATATLETLSTQCNCKATAGKAFLKGKQPPIDIAIAGVIRMTSAGFTGSISLCFPEKTFLNVMGSMLGEKYEKLTKDLEDGAGELLNIIFGCAKRSLAQAGHTVDRAIPSIMKGNELKIKYISKAPVVIPFESESGKFQIEIIVE